jgi:hypothetical protein
MTSQRNERSSLFLSSSICTATARPCGKCGIDPNVLALILSRQDRPTDVPEPLLEPAADDDDAGGSSVTVVGAPRWVGAGERPSPAGSRTGLEQANAVGRVSLPSSSGGGQHADQTTTTTAADTSGAEFSVTPRPVLPCPRCLLAFGSTDLMLDHLKADHLDADRFTHTSLDLVGVTHRNVGADLAVPRQPDAVLTDLEGAHRGVNKLRSPRRVVVAVILAYLLIVWTVANLA